MPRKRKIQLGSIMCLGTFSAAAGAVKTYYLQQLRSRADFTYDATSLMIWYTTEMYVIIIAGSLPTLRPLFQRSISIYRSFKGRSSKGYEVYEQPPHALQPYPGKQMSDSMLQTAKGIKGRSSDQVVSATNTEGITKTVDFTLAATGGEQGKRWERWEDEHFMARGTRADERV
ncbi:MAG: hypothetical protein Q9224_005948 [Gallowayella concinna]